MGIHIYIDNSNLFGGAHRCAAEMEPTVPFHAVRIDFRNFVSLIERDRPRSVGVWAGSVPPGSDELWDHARDLGFNVDLLKRVREDDGRLLEQGVDELIHAKISDSLLDYDPPQTLVLVTGDGSDTPHGTSFVRKVEQAISRSWKVELYSWHEQLSGRFVELSSRYEDRVSVFSLDKWYNYIVFVKGGSYPFKDSFGRIKIGQIDSRSVHQIPESIQAIPMTFNRR